MVHPQFNSATSGDNAFSWALAKIQDINGNLTYVYYAQDANQVYLDEIRYNGHTQSLPTTSCAKFLLDSAERSDKSISYATGYRVETNKRLSKIDVLVYDYNEPAWKRVRQYRLEYGRSPSTLRSLLTSVKMCGIGDPNSAGSYLPPLTFEYQQKPFEFERDAQGYPILRDWGPVDSGDWGNAGRTEWHEEDGHDVETAYNADVTLTDINNDGLPDRVTRNAATNPYDPYGSPPGNVFKVHLNTGTGFAPEGTDWGPVDGLGAASWPYNDMFNSTGAMRKQFWFNWNPQQTQPSLTSLMDVNGDGFVDRVMHRNTAFNALYPAASALNYLYVQYGTGLGFERTNSITGGGPDFTTRAWGPLDPQGFTGYGDWLHLYSQGYAWNSADCSWEDSDYSITRVAMLDINGDGLPDRVTQGIDGQSFWDYAFPPTQGKNVFRVQLGTGSGLERTGAGPGGGTDYVTVDWGPVDAQDVTGSGPVDHAWNAIVASAPQDNHRGTFVTLLDINGDGLPDRVMREGASPYDHFEVQFNTGYGFERKTSSQGGGTDFRTRDWGPLYSEGQGGWEGRCPQSTTSGSAGGDYVYSGTYIDLFDINGDGLPDRVLRGASPFNSFNIELNTGTGFAGQIDSSDIEWHGVSTQGESHAEWWGCVGLTMSYVTGDVDRAWELVTMRDINGDGLVDRVMSDKNGGGVLKVQLNKGPLPDLLRKVKGALGGAVEVAYKPSTQYDNRDHQGKSRLGFPVQTVSALTVDDGLGTRSTTAYDYSRGFFDGQAREFRGFGKVKVTDPGGAMSITYFHQGGGYEDPDGGEFSDAGSSAKKGMPYRVEV
jgi:hypothetical protein